MKTTKQLEKIANQIRQDIINMLLTAGSGHSAGPLGMADVFTALYLGGIAKLDSKKKNDPARDRVVLSNAHICPVLYATLAHAGFIPHKQLKTLRKLGSPLQGHSNNHYNNGIETCGGPLGQGISQAIGMALASRMNRRGTSDVKRATKVSYHTWCLMSDGELDEGQCWEAFMLAGKMDLRELTVFVDRNNIQIDGPTEDIMPLENLADKFKAFNWFVIEVDGHNIREILDAMKKAQSMAANPTVIICHTIPGKGVDFMENKYEWHGKPPNKEEAKIALHELRTLNGKITSEHQ
ncbi:MAG: transketolase [Patescibacteria group bacterium]|nr:transketolase [Patescibacteria group bacterium]